MTVEITIQCGNAAFDSPEAEVCRILRELSDRIENFNFSNRVLFDMNGNRVGELTITDDDEHQNN